MSIIFKGVEMPTACCFVDGEHSAFAHFEYCKFYNICEKRDTIKTNCKPSDCPVKALEQESQTFKWCDTCKEYDQENHCCHRWSKVIRNTVEEMKQEYIERDVLDKIRAEIEQLPTNTRINWDGCCPDIDYPEIEYVDVSKAELLGIIDKYKAETEE